MPPQIGCVCSCLLLFLQATQASLRVTVSPSVIQAKPGSDVMLPCRISGSSVPIDLTRLAVTWKKGPEDIAKFDDQFETKRPGAKMTAEKLREGNATLFLPHIQDTEEGVYTCIVIYVPNKAEGTVELRVEAPPHLTHGTTKLQLGKPSRVTCMASGFYPGTVSVTWLRDGKIVKGPDLVSGHLNPDGMYNAESALELTPQIDDDNASFSCQIDHKAIKQPLREDFQVQVQAQPMLEIITVPSKKKFYAAECLVNNFYPREIHIQWLRNRMQQEPYETQPQIMPNGTFSIKSALVIQETNVEVTYTCRVQHESLDTLLEDKVLWWPNDESDSVTQRTPPSSQSLGEKRTSQSSCPTVLSLCPTYPSVLGTSVSSLPWLLGVIGLILGLSLGSAATIFYYKKKAKDRTASAKKSEVLTEEEKHLNTSKL